MSRSTTAKVRRRRVFYIPGYDPIHPRRYRELYRSEGRAQAAISGYDIALSPKSGDGPYGWHVDATIDGQGVRTDMDVLVWSDIVRDSMSNSIPATYLQLVRTAWIYISTGALFRLMRLRKGPVIAALYPVGMLIVQLLLAFVIGAFVIWAGKAALIPVLGVFGHVIAACAGLGISVATLAWFKAKDSRFFAYYLMHDYAYAASTNGANPAPLEARMDEFRTLIEAALDTDVDEVLIVGHSSGAHLGVSVLADILRAGPQPKLSFLSLGQVVPMVSFLPDAHRLRADLAYLSAQSTPWVDVTAPGDGCSFALCDPVAVSGVAGHDKRWPLVFSAAFTQSLSPARWKELRWRFFRLHFQYLCAFDRPKDYDYFQITAGPLTLNDRFEGRVPSKSRIETPVNRFTGTAA